MTFAPVGLRSLLRRHTFLLWVRDHIAQLPCFVIGRAYVDLLHVQMSVIRLLGNELNSRGVYRGGEQGISVFGPVQVV